MTTRFMRGTPVLSIVFRKFILRLTVLIIIYQAEHFPSRISTLCLSLTENAQPGIVQLAVNT